MWYYLRVEVISEIGTLLMVINPVITVVIPCYNDGVFIDEAVDSVLCQTFQDFEIIIINDGSTDEFTNELLKTYSKPKTKVFTIANQGPSVARNIAIEKAKGRYILPLDADDRIFPKYLEKAFKIIEANSSLGIVYCEAELIGAQTGKWLLAEYSLPTMLKGNCIFASALFKRTSWEKVGGYKKEMKIALEDYEFWLSLIEIGEGVYRIPEVLFQYRKHARSRRNLISHKTLKRVRVQIIKLHIQLYWSHFRILNSRLKIRVLFLKIGSIFFVKSESKY